MRDNDFRDRLALGRGRACEAVELPIIWGLAGSSDGKVRAAVESTTVVPLTATTFEDTNEASARGAERGIVGDDFSGAAIVGRLNVPSEGLGLGARFETPPSPLAAAALPSWPAAPVHNLPSQAAPGSRFFSSAGSRPRCSCKSFAARLGWR